MTIFYQLVGSRPVATLHEDGWDFGLQESKAPCIWLDPGYAFGMWKMKKRYAAVPVYRFFFCVIRTGFKPVTF